MASVRFTGTYAELREQLSSVAPEGGWSDLNSNQKQYRATDGGVLNWYPSTGTVVFQGPKDARSRLESAVLPLLSKPGAASQGGVGPKSESVPDLASQPVGTFEVPVPAQFLGQAFSDSELVLGLVGPVGTELNQVADILMERLGTFKYKASQIRVSKDIIPQLGPVKPASQSATTGSEEYLRVSGFMDAGNVARQRTGDNSVLALGVAAKISADRPKEANGQPKPLPRCAYIIHSLKHPDEVARLREIYPEGFYLIGVHADEKRRHEYLTQGKRLTPTEADLLIRRDEDEQLPYGQRTSDSFHLSDFFVRIDPDADKLRYSVWRILDLLFGHPHITPTFDEYAMFLAFSAALRRPILRGRLELS